MNNNNSLITFLALGAVLLVAVGVYVYSRSEGEPKKGVPDNAVVSDESKVTDQHKVMKPVIPADDDQTKTDAEKADTNADSDVDKTDAKSKTSDDASTNKDTDKKPEPGKQDKSDQDGDDKGS